MSRLQKLLFLGLMTIYFSWHPTIVFSQVNVQKLCNQPQCERGSLISATFLARLSEQELDQKFASVGFKALNGVEVYKIVFQTVMPVAPQNFLADFSTRAKIASGIVVIPDHQKNVYPWISLQHGTISGHAEAPSVELSEGLLEASQGFVTVVQDYLGFGEADDIFHPYMIQQSYADTGIDMLRAARHYASELGIHLGPLFLRGYSEGGFATMVLQKAIEVDYPLEFHAVASAPAAGPYDLVVTSKVLASRPIVNPVNLPFVLLSYNRWLNQQNWDLAKVFNINADYAYQLFGGGYRTKELFKILPWENAKLFSPEMVADVISDNPSTSEGKTLRTWLSQQSITNKGWAPMVPTRLYHCVDDTAVPVEATNAALSSFKAYNSRSPVESILIPSPDSHHPYDHMSCPGFYSSIIWFAEILRREEFKDLGNNGP